MLILRLKWLAWREEASKKAKIEFGLPLKVIRRITSDGQTDSNSHVSGYSIVEADSKDDVLKLLETHPQLKMSGASIDVLEMLPMPGL